MRQATITILLVLALASAGCIGGEPLNEGTTSTANVDAASLLEAAPNATALAERVATEGLDAPEWQVGDAWTVEHFGFSTASCTFAVVDAASDYTLAPTCEESAVNDATFDVSWLGRIRGSDLAGSQQGNPVKYYDFPLQDGKSWSTVWDGNDITLTATFAPNLAAPGAPSGPGFTIVGLTSDGETYVTYDYAPALKWWTKIDFAAGYGLTVKAFQTGWTGTYKIATSNPLLTYSSSVPGFFVPPAQQFTVSEGQTALVVLLIGQFGGHAYVARLVDPAGVTAWESMSSGAEGSIFEVATLAPTPGAWTFAVEGTFDPQTGFFSLAANEVLVTDATLGVA